MSMKKCINCGADLDPEAKFCMDCGVEQTPETNAQPTGEPQTADTSGRSDVLPDAGHIPDYSMNNGGYKVEDGGGGTSVLFVVMILGILLMASVIVWAAFAILAVVPDKHDRYDEFTSRDNGYSYRDDWEYPDNREYPDNQEYPDDEEIYGFFEPDESDPDMEGYYPEGSYQIGIDIPEGIYFLNSEVITDENGNITSGARYEIDMDGKTDNGWFGFSRYVELRGQGYIDMTFCDAYDISVSDVHGDPFEHSGMFMVGRDLAPGTYKLVEVSDKYGMSYAIYDSLDEVYSDSLYDVGEFNVKDGDEITLTDGQFLELQGCVLTDDLQ